MTAVDDAHKIGVELRTQVAQAGQILHHLGLVDYLGHCSARVPGTDLVVIKPKHSPRTRSPEQLGPAEMIVINLDGELVEGVERPPAELFIHTEIYRGRPDVRAVVHTHQPTASVLGLLDAPLKPLLHVPSVLTNGGRIEKWPVSRLVTTPELGRQLVAALGDSALCHLQGHGIVSVADTMQRATVIAIALEQLAEANLRVLQTGLTPRVISDDELADLGTTVAPVAGRWAYYLQLVEQSASPRNS
ncbi:MAG TPA: class II aldolase/adducin family protein [Pseudonocardiaceae bacterium]|jgi:ribulose-5-phosphate 4-epimerase/fuculose-1-phosphate aldolase|nr:class II aldolase/adducin family protein [Pseudonocardiaceae bacterium]